MSTSENQITGEIVDAAYCIHTKLGPGLLESVYGIILTRDLQKRGLRVQREHPIPLIYETIHFEAAFRADLLVENQIIVELKACDSILPIHKQQLLTYLRLANKPLGLLINFNVRLIKDGIRRIVNNLQEP
jgi:GxxExxY protein